LKVPVFDVRYFQFKNPSGYVIHEIPKKPWQNILIGIGPFILNTVVGALIGSALPYLFSNLTVLIFLT